MGGRPFENSHELRQDLNDDRILFMPTPLEGIRVIEIMKYERGED
jgi:hypothetical protein